MRILYCVTGAEFGGAVVHVLGMMQADVDKVQVVGLVAAPEPTMMSRARDIKVEIFPNRYFVRRVQLINDLRALWPVFQAIRRFNPDFVSAHSTKAGLAARLTCAILRKPVIFTAHGWAFAEGRTGWKRKFLILAEYIAAKFTARIICVSQHDMDLAMKFRVAPAKKLVLIRNGVDQAPWLGLDRNKVRQQLGLEGIVAITMVGRLVPPKDPLTLLKACQLLKGKFRLLIVGDGELRRQSQAFVARENLENQVTFMGERKDVAEILAASDIFSLISYREGLPLAIIEAEFAGLPIVASNVGGVSELVQDGVTGYLVPPGNVQTLAEKLQRLLDNVNLRKEVGQASRQKAIREFSFAHMASKTHAVYEEVIQLATDSRGNTDQKRKTITLED